MQATDIGQLTTDLSVMQFFVLRVASNKEDRVRDALNRKIKIEAVEDTIGRVLVPIERVRSMKGVGRWARAASILAQARLIERAEDFCDPGDIVGGHAVPGTDADLRELLLPHIDDGWTSP